MSVPTIYFKRIGIINSIVELPKIKYNSRRWIKPVFSKERNQLDEITIEV